MRFPHIGRIHTMSKELDLSELSQVGREAIERGDNPRSLNEADEAAYNAAVEDSGKADPTATPLGKGEGEDS
jgi:hypothetical protein